LNSQKKSVSVSGSFPSGRVGSNGSSRAAPLKRMIPARSVRSNGFSRAAPLKRLTPARSVRSNGFCRAAPLKRLTPARSVRRYGFSRAAPLKRLTPARSVRSNGFSRAAPLGQNDDSHCHSRSSCWGKAAEGGPAENSPPGLAIGTSRSCPWVLRFPRPRVDNITTVMIKLGAFFLHRRQSQPWSFRLLESHPSRLPETSRLVFSPYLGVSSSLKSGREDLNLRPHGPEPCALTGLRYAPPTREDYTLPFSN
jgi:hypothetical protein